MSKMFCYIFLNNKVKKYKKNNHQNLNWKTDSKKSRHLSINSVFSKNSSNKAKGEKWNIPTEKSGEGDAGFNQQNNLETIIPQTK